MERNLAQWLVHMEAIHARPIELGLERVRRVLDALRLRHAFPVITVGGTNGKGSTCAMLERVLACAGYAVGLYSSPHLLRYNERVRVGGAPVSDEALCEAFAAVETARGEVPLTYFEFGTLAAWQLFVTRGLDAVVLEVGLGGRLDAVNAIDADCAVVTTVALDHMDFLGPDRESIGFEKAGIFRRARPAVVADGDPPSRLLDHARAVGAQLRLIGRDFGYLPEAGQWQYWSRRDDRIVRRPGLAWPALRGATQLANASAAIAALEAMADTLPVSMQDIRRGLMEVELPARFQVLPGRPAVVLDVAHNPQAASVLADNLGSMGFARETWAVFGMLRDKDVAQVASRMAPRIDRWLLATLPGPRGALAAELETALRGAGVEAPIERFDSPLAAWDAARDRVREDDRIAVFGSFLTVADVLRGMARQGGSLK